MKPRKAVCRGTQKTNRNNFRESVAGYVPQVMQIPAPVFFGILPDSSGCMCRIHADRRSLSDGLSIHNEDILNARR